MLRKRFTRTELRRLEDISLFVNQRLELIEGDLLEKNGPKTRPSVDRIPAAGDDQAYSEPEPDLAVLQAPDPPYANRHPRGDELRLVVEVADTSAAFDRNIKAALYARAGVPEYWVVDFQGRAIFVYRGSRDGVWHSVVRLAEPDTLSPDSQPDSTAQVSSLLPPAPKSN